jgi:hypothetical protein
MGTELRMSRARNDDLQRALLEGGELAGQLAGQLAESTADLLGVRQELNEGQVGASVHVGRCMCAPVG